QLVGDVGAYARAERPDGAPQREARGHAAQPSGAVAGQEIGPVHFEGLACDAAGRHRAGKGQAHPPITRRAMPSLTIAGTLAPAWRTARRTPASTALSTSALLRLEPRASTLITMPPPPAMPPTLLSGKICEPR